MIFLYLKKSVEINKRGQMKDIRNLLIAGSAKTPLIEFNHITGDLVLSGKSIPENAARIYEPVIEWIEGYIKSPRQTTNLHLNLEYFNSSSLIWFAKMVKVLSKIENRDFVLLIHNYFDLEDFNVMEIEDLKDLVISLVGNVKEINISIGVKIYGTDTDKKIVKESTIFI
jgi:hypothetical protein